MILRSIIQAGSIDNSSFESCAVHLCAGFEKYVENFALAEFSEGHGKIHAAADRFYSQHFDARFCECACFCGGSWLRR